MIHTTNNTFHREDVADIREQVENKTYIQLTRFDQGIITYEQNIFPNTCTGTCESYSNDYNMHAINNCVNNEFPCEKCNRLYGCKTIPYSIEACINETTKIYQVKVNEGAAYFRCEKDAKLYSAHSYIVKKDIICDVCFCYCDDLKRDSDRFVSLQMVESNITANEVVTGMRVVKLNHILYLQIQVGKMLPLRKIDVDTLRWVPVETHNQSLSYVLSKDEKMNLGVLDVGSSHTFVITG